MWRVAGRLACTLWPIVGTALLAAQSPHEIVRGRVTTDSGVPIAGASVRVARLTSLQSQTALSDSGGNYAVDWPNGSGAYIVSIQAPGRMLFQAQVRRAGADSVLVVDARLRPLAAVELPPIAVRAAPQPDREPPIAVSTGSTETIDYAGNAARRLAPDVAGDVTSIVQLDNPGALSVPGGFSALGLSPGQNSVVLNGMPLPGTAIPRTAGVFVRSTTTSYDPANGWFSGARTNLQLPVGHLFSSWDTHLTLDAPQVQATDPIGAKLGQRFTSVDGVVNGEGRLVDDRFAYNVSLQGGRRTADVASLLSADADLLQHAGIAADSAARFRQLAQQAGVPLTAPGINGQQTTDNVVFLGRLDHTPYDWNSMTPARATWGLTGYATWNRQGARGLAPTATPAHAGVATREGAAIQGDYSFYFGHTYLGDVRSGVTVSRNRLTPYLTLPDGVVQLVSALPDGSTGLAGVQFGGNGALESDQRTWTWETIAELQLYPPGAAAHRVKLDADLRFDHFAQDLLANPLGAFMYNSLSDLATNQPASFTRTLNARTTLGGAWNAALALGDLWRASPSLQLLYGVRLEGNAYVDPPAYNPAVDAQFGERTDHAPESVHLSPRLGLTYALPGPQGRPKWTLRGGVGEFRNLLDPNLLAGPFGSTGLAGSVTQLSCFGSAVPTPDWSGYLAVPSSVPEQCGGAAAAFVDTAPSVQLIAPGFTAERSWRANLTWSGALGRNPFSIGGIVSANRDQHGTLDLNFSGIPRFVLPDEGRPVFAAPTSIVPATGAVSPVDARLSTAFGRVVSRVADLRSLSKQLTLTFRPTVSLNHRIGDPMIAYTLSSTRALQRGFDAATFDTPTTAEWARGDFDVRHQFVIQTVFRPFGDTRALVFLVGHVQSGLPFTPMVGSDVNGDGLANDRAFIFDPATAPDANVARDLRALISSASPGVRHCLERQLGRPAGRNSCSGPWTTQLNAGVRLSGEQLLHLSRLDFTLNLANISSGLDQLLHGNNHMHGWGAAASPDPTLYVVRGFDPTTQRFTYQVNPRFGVTLPALTTLRAPFRLTLDVHIDLGRSLPRQELNRWLLPGRNGHAGPRMNAATLRSRLERQVPDPYTELLGASDSLLLSAAQVGELRHVDSQYQHAMDSVWTNLADLLTSLPDDFDAAAAYRTMDAGIDDAWELTRQDVLAHLKQILSPDQLVTVGGWAGQLYRAPGRVHIRLFLQ